MHHAVTVICEGPDLYGTRILGQPFYHHASTVTQLSASGILISPSRVLCPDSVVLPFLSNASSPTNTSLPNVVDGAAIKVLLSDGTTLRKASITKFVQFSQVSSLLSRIMSQSPAGLKLGWAVRETRAQMESFMRHRVAFPEDDPPADVVSHVSFVVLTLENPLEAELFRPLQVGTVPAVGDTIYAVSSPFGIVCTTALAHSQSIGHICNLIHTHPSHSSLPFSSMSLSPRSSTTVSTTSSSPLEAASDSILCSCPVAAASSDSPFTVALMDCRLLPGSEGAPLFNAMHEWIGIVLHPLRHETAGVELCLALLATSALQTTLHSLGALLHPPVSAHSLLHSLSHHPQFQNHGQGALVSPTLAKARRSLVQIRCGISWGTGVLISRDGYILTNAHVVPDVSAVHVRWEEERPSGSGSVPAFTPWLSCKVLFASKGSLDIALLLVMPAKAIPSFAAPYDEELHSSLDFVPSQGSSVCVFGYAMFGLNDVVRATATFGMLSKVISDPGRDHDPVAYQTDAAVHEGNSGGMLLGLDKEANVWRWVGVVNHHGRRADGTTIPRLNFAIALKMLRPLFAYVAAPNAANMKRVVEKVGMVDPFLVHVFGLTPMVSKM
jgi:S1-C subfamily serine protease